MERQLLRRNLGEYRDGEALVLMGKSFRHRFFKQVVTLGPADLGREMDQLWSLVTKSGTRPDLLIGIATGGERCARLISVNVPAGMMVVALRRPGTQIKQRSSASRLLARMPYLVTNMLRRFEDLVLEHRGKNLAIAAPTAQLNDDIAAVARVVHEQALQTILVVDDAVDSGATLGRVVTDLRMALPPSARIVTAVLTQTRDAPVFVPDFRLHDRVLLRFPWSFDFRGPR